MLTNSFNFVLETFNCDLEVPSEIPSIKAISLCEKPSMAKRLKTVFNLFAIEGFSHKEIATMLGISEGTSKSQLNVSRTKLKELVNNLYYQKAK